MYLVNLGALSTVAAFFCPGTLYLVRKSFLHASQYFFSVSRGGTSGWLIWVDFFILRRQRQKTPGNLGKPRGYRDAPRWYIFITKRTQLG